jgi:hypothetical protein
MNKLFLMQNHEQNGIETREYDSHQHRLEWTFLFMWYDPNDDNGVYQSI